MRILKKMCLLILFISKSGTGLTQGIEVHPLPLVERKYCFTEGELREIDKVFYLHDLYKSQNERLTKNNAVLEGELKREKDRKKSSMILNGSTLFLILLLILI